MVFRAKGVAISFVLGLLHFFRNGKLINAFVLVRARRDNIQEGRLDVATQPK